MELIREGIHRFTPARTVAGDGTQGLRDGTGTNAQFYLPSAVRLDSQGNLIVGELMGGIRKISPQTKLRRYSVTT